MSDKLQGGIKAGSTSVSLDVVLRLAADGTEKTAAAHSDVTAYYWRQGGSPTSVTMANLASITAAWSSGGWEEADATNMPGSYRFDPPDAAFATGADWVEISLKVAGCFVFKERFALTTNVLQTGDVFGQLPANFSVLSISASTGLVNIIQAAADKVWGTTTRTLSALGTTLVQEIWDRATSALTVVGSAGKLLVDNLTAIKTKTDGLPADTAASLTAISAKTGLIPAAPAAVGDIPSAAAVSAAVLAAFEAATSYRTLLANVNGAFVFTPPASYPGTGTLVLKNQANNTTLCTITLTFNSAGVITTRTTA